MTTEEAYEYLIENGVNVNLQTLRRWLRIGEIKATLKSRKQGYDVSKDSLDEQIRKKRQQGVKRTEEYLIGYQAGFEAAKARYFTEEFAELKMQLAVVMEQTEKK